MKSNSFSFIALLFILTVFGVLYVSQMPRWIPNDSTLDEFSTKRALVHVQKIAQQPHYISSIAHENTAQYLVNELKKLGLQVEFQEGTSLTDWGNAVYAKNIIARIKGTGSSKALLLLSHYDSAPHSFSKGASDDASGIATILESVRAFKASKKVHKNDIVILFTDAEELGLNGAALFVTQHKWAKDVGLALNFEARGTSGPGYMLMEVNQGNAKMIEAFSNAHPLYSVTNSLMYSIYKMLPNDTDLTVFREKGKIPGFNFAFIDHHFNYHTQQDDAAHLNPNSLTHQGSYLMPLLNYFSNANLHDLNSVSDDVYFNLPFYIVHYPFDWVLPLSIIAFVLFVFLVIIGIGKRILFFNQIGKGFLIFIGLLLLTGSIGFLGWKFILSSYPNYAEILQGFTYNGHDYVFAFVYLALALAFLIYHKTNSVGGIMNQSIAPIFLWSVLNLFIALLLPGAGFFIIPVYFSLLQLGYYVVTQKTNPVLFLILNIPLLLLLCPFVLMFPIGLGLKILFGAMVLVAVIFGLGFPVFGHFTHKKSWALAMMVLSISFIVNAHIHSDFEKGKAKPNSLVYVLNSDTKKAYWGTYDGILDSWTSNYLGNHPQKATTLNQFPLFSKYDTKFSFEAKAPLKPILKSTIQFEKDTIIGKYRYLKITITPNRKINRYDVFAPEQIQFYQMTVNGAKNIEQKGNLYPRAGKRILSYYVANQIPLSLNFAIEKNKILDMTIAESSFDLLSNPQFSVPNRQDWMMPKPFVLNDAVVIIQKLKPSIKAAPKPIAQKTSLINKDSLNIK